MAQFKAQVSGQRGRASRLGSKRSGIWARVDGWRSGVEVVGQTDSAGRDVFEVRVTQGSGSSPGAVLAMVREAGAVVWPIRAAAPAAAVPAQVLFPAE